MPKPKFLSINIADMETFQMKPKLSLFNDE